MYFYSAGNVLRIWNLFFVNVSTIRVVHERKSIPYKPEKGSRNCRPPSRSSWKNQRARSSWNAVAIGTLAISDSVGTGSSIVDSVLAIRFAFRSIPRSSRFDLCVRVCPWAAPWLPNSIHTIDPFRSDRSDYVREYALRSSVDNRSVSNAGIDSRAASLSVITEHVHAAFPTRANIPYSSIVAPFEREPFRSNV